MRVFDYLFREGLRGVMHRSWEKVSAVFGGASARTVFLYAEEMRLNRSNNLGADISCMGYKDLDEFEQFNFFPHISGKRYLETEGWGSVICREAGRIVGYACYEIGGFSWKQMKLGLVHAMWIKTIAEEALMPPWFREQLMRSPQKV